MIVALLVAGCTSNGGGTPPSSASSTPSATPSATASTSPSTPPPSTTPPPTSSATPVRGTVTPVVTYSGFNQGSSQLEASAYVDGVQQDAGGECTLTVTSPDGATFTGSHQATPDATTTQCGTIAVTPTPLTPGTWTGVVAYQSATASGQSAPFTVEVTS